MNQQLRTAGLEDLHLVPPIDGAIRQRLGNSYRTRGLLVEDHALLAKEVQEEVMAGAAHAASETYLPATVEAVVFAIVSAYCVFL